METLKTRVQIELSNTNALFALFRNLREKHYELETLVHAIELFSFKGQLEDVVVQSEENATDSVDFLKTNVKTTISNSDEFINLIRDFRKKAHELEKNTHELGRFKFNGQLEEAILSNNKILIAQNGKSKIEVSDGDLMVTGDNIKIKSD